MVERLHQEPLQEELKEGEEEKLEEPLLEASMVFLGITGSGKSTLMQAIKDFVLEKDYNSRKEMIRTQKLGESETQKIEKHEIAGPKWSVTIIDTPGLADTRGPEKDKENIEQLVKSLIKFGKFHAFCFVMKADENRETEQLKQTYQTLKYLLPEKLDNFFLCLTRSSVSSMSKVMEIIVENLGLPKKHIFFFDNRAYEKSLDDKSTKMKELKYKKSQKTILNFLSTASQLIPYESKGYKQLSKQKNKILALIHYLLWERIISIEQKVTGECFKNNKIPNDFNFIDKYLTLNYDAIDDSANSKSHQRSFTKNKTCVRCAICGCKCHNIKILKNNDEEFEIKNFLKSSSEDYSKTVTDCLNRDSTIGQKLIGIAFAAGGIISSPALVGVIGSIMLYDKIKGRSCQSCYCTQKYHTLYSYKDIYDCSCDTQISLQSEDSLNHQLEMIEKAVKDCILSLSQVPLIGYKYDYMQYLQYCIWRMSQKTWRENITGDQRSCYIKHIEQMCLKEKQLQEQIQGIEESSQ